MKKILEQLTKITDLTILFAAIFVFLAYITPEGISESSINNLRTNAQTIASSLSSAEKQAANANTRLQESNSFSSDLRSSINELEGEIINLEAQVNLIDPTIDQISIDELGAEINELNSGINELNTGLTNNESMIDIAQRALQTANKNVQSLRDNLRTAEQEVADLEAELESSRAISWIQPVRQNTDKLINAAGFDGFIAGFAALIFCLVVKRRRDWFRRMFGLYFK